jgi:PBP1b-binding outer membrane lipoprotein LpoB
MLWAKKQLYLTLWCIILLFTSCIGAIDTQNDVFVKDKISQITAQNPESHIELLFYKHFNYIARNKPISTNYLLTYSFEVSNIQTLSVTQNSSNLKNTSVTVEFKLKDTSTGQSIHQGSISSEATSGAVSGLYAQEQSEKFAKERLSILLAQRVYQNLYLYFLENPDS